MQKDAPNDQELTLKKRARRRLVGAIALVLLMIIVLPIILKDQAITAPAEEVTITLSNQNQSPEPSAAISDFDSNVVPAEIAPLNTESVINEPATQVEQAPAKPVAEEKIALVQPKPAEKKVVNSPKFYVQIGVFSDEANVKQLQAKLTDLGYSSQTEKIDTAKGKKIRLRTHLLGERNEAAIALQNIKDAGLTGMVVSQ